MASVAYSSTIFRKGLERVTRNKPSGLDVVFRKELEEALYTDSACEETTGDLRAKRALLEGASAGKAMFLHLKSNPLLCSFQASQPPHRCRHRSLRGHASCPYYEVDKLCFLA